MNKPQRLAFVVSTNVVILIVLLIAVEWGYRQLRPTTVGPELAMAISHPTRVWSYKPNYETRFASEEFSIAIRTNSRGLRSAETLDGDITVLAIGDSFTFGWGVDEDDRFSDVFAREIEKRSRGKRVSVINAGHWMYTFDQQLLILGELLERQNPDLVIHGWYWPHAYTLLGHQWQTRQEELISISVPGLVLTPQGALRFQSSVVASPLFGSRVLAEISRHWLNYRLVSTTTKSELDLLDDSNPTAQEAWARTRAILDQTSEMVRRAGVAYIPFGIPRDSDVSREEWETWEVDQLERSDLGLPDRRLARWSEEFGVDYVEMTSAYRDRYTPKLYFQRDGHWNVAGHALAAEILAEVALPKISPH